MPHSPAPWFLNGPWHIQAASQPAALSTVVAHVLALRNGNLQEREANALLIAKAPQLLKRLEDNLQFLIAWRYEYAGKSNDAHNNEQRDRIDAAYKETVALIAEAHGTKQVQS